MLLPLLKELMFSLFSFFDTFLTLYPDRVDFLLLTISGRYLKSTISLFEYSTSIGILVL